MLAKLQGAGCVAETRVRGSKLLAVLGLGILMEL